MAYGKRHRGKSVNDLWQFVYFTDEFHFDPSSQPARRILRERGTRYDTENLYERGKKSKVSLHVAGWINWHEKCESLEFYKDETPEAQPPRPRKPVKSKFESETEFLQRLVEWEASLPPKAETKPKGNAMTQKYYKERLLGVYVEAVQRCRLRQENYPHSVYLQEDGDPSHGMRKPGLARQLKNDNWVTNLLHPAQSPDLNPCEACWNILKQRVRRRTWQTEEQLKEIIQEE